MAPLIETIIEFFEKLIDFYENIILVCLIVASLLIRFSGNLLCIYFLFQELYCYLRVTKV